MCKRVPSVLRANLPESLMPYLHANKIIPKELDRRIKLSDEERKEIKHLYHVEGWAVRKIARYFSDRVSRRVIQYTIKPELYETMLANARIRRLDGRYKPEKVKYNTGMKEHRHYKESIKSHLIPRQERQGSKRTKI